MAAAIVAEASQAAPSWPHREKLARHGVIARRREHVNAEVGVVAVSAALLRPRAHHRASEGNTLFMAWANEGIAPHPPAIMLLYCGAIRHGLLPSARNRLEYRRLPARAIAYICHFAGVAVAASYRPISSAEIGASKPKAPGNLPASAAHELMASCRQYPHRASDSGGGM